MDKFGNFMNISGKQEIVRKTRNFLFRTVTKIIQIIIKSSIT